MKKVLKRLWEDLKELRSAFILLLVFFIGITIIAILLLSLSKPKVDKDYTHIYWSVEGTSTSRDRCVLDSYELNGNIIKFTCATDDSYLDKESYSMDFANVYLAKQINK